MRKLFITILFAILLITPLKAEETLFPYPEVPAEIENFNERANYAVSHFWDRFAFNRPITDSEKLGQAFYDYLSLITLADKDVALSSIDNLISKLEKDPVKLLEFGMFAREMCYDLYGDFVSDELYLPFAKAISKNKKIKSAEKSVFATHAKILETNTVGLKAPTFTFTKPDGSKGSFDDYYAKYIILFFGDPNCGDCNLARVRLSADININRHINDGELLIMYIFPGAADKDWKKSVEGYNPSWIVGANPNIEDFYDIRTTPTIYYIDPRHKILSKDMSVDQILEAFRQINIKKSRQ